MINVFFKSHRENWIRYCFCCLLTFLCCWGAFQATAAASSQTVTFTSVTQTITVVGSADDPHGYGFYQSNSYDTLFYAPIGISGSSYGLLDSNASGIITTSNASYTIKTVDSGGIFSTFTITLNSRSTVASSDTVTLYSDSNIDGTLDTSLILNITFSPLTLMPTTLSAGTVGSSYTTTLSASGGDGSYTYSVTNGALPAGFSLNTSTGTLSGTPTAIGTYTFTILATDSSGFFTGSQSYTLVINAPTITLAPTTLSAGTAGTPYSTTISASGGTAPYTYSVSAGALPAGLTFSSSGTLSGTPTAAGTFAFTITATDNAGFTASRAYTLAINAPTITLAPTTLSAGTVGSTYSTTLSASGGTAPYTYSVTSGALPAGFSLNTSTGTLSGTPTVASSYTFTITATDSASFTGSRAYTLAISAPTITLAPTTLGTGTVGSSYSTTISTSGGTAPYTYSVTSGALPTGLTLNSSGTLSGTPTVAGNYNFTLTATDSAGFTGSRAYTLAINAPTITLTPTALGTGTVGSSYSTTISASGGTAPYTYSVTSGALPTGLTLNSSGTLSGTPTVAGNYNFTLTATDNASFTGSQAYTLVINAPTITLTPTTLSAGTVGSSYSTSLSASGGTGPYAYSVSGTLPTGLTLSSTGTFSGTPTVAGTYTFTVTATDSGSYTGIQSYTLVIQSVSPPTVSNKTVLVPANSSGVAIDMSGSVSGIYTSLSILAAPSHGSAIINSSIITYTPTTGYSGNDSFTYTATGPGGTSSAATVYIVVERPDPSKDAEVTGIINSQVNMAKNFYSAQVSNIEGHLEYLHSSQTEVNKDDTHSLQTGRQRRTNSLNSTLISKPKNYNYGGGDEGKNNIVPILPLNFTSPPKTQGLSWWSAGSIQIGKSQSDNDNSNNASIRTNGITLGVDRQVSPVLTLGEAINIGRQYSDIGDNGSNIKGDAKGVAFYGSWHREKGNYFDALIGYQALTFQNNRYITAYGDMVTSTRHGNQWYASVIAGHENTDKKRLLGVYGRLTKMQTKLGEVTEDGSSLYALTYADQTINSFNLTIGARMEWQYQKITPKARIEFQHEFQNVSSAYVAYKDDLSNWYQIAPQISGENILNTEFGFDVNTCKDEKISLLYTWRYYSSGNSSRYLSLKYMLRC